MPAGTAGGASAPLARLRGVTRWDVGVVQDGQRWVTLTLHWLDDEMEPTAVTFAPEDAEAIGRALVHYADRADLADIADSN